MSVNSGADNPEGFRSAGLELSLQIELLCQRTVRRDYHQSAITIDFVCEGQRFTEQTLQPVAQLTLDNLKRRRLPLDHQRRNPQAVILNLRRRQLIVAQPKSVAVFC